MYVVAIIQARMGSERLPGKVLYKVVKHPLLSLLIDRLRMSKEIDRLIVATSVRERDEPIKLLCEEEGVYCFCGSELDVLDRFYQAATEWNAKVVVRICADCPLLDPAVVDRVIRFYCDAKSPFDYVSNTMKRTYPRGMDVEVFSFDALEKAVFEAKLPAEREHVTPFIYNHPEMFKLGKVEADKDNSQYRLCVDTTEDLTLVTNIFEELYRRNNDFTLEDILATLKKHPDWAAINASVVQKK